MYKLIIFTAFMLTGLTLYAQTQVNGYYNPQTHQFIPGDNRISVSVCINGHAPFKIIRKDKLNYETDRIGFIDTAGNIVVNPIYVRCSAFNGEFALLQDTDAQVGLINRAGEIIIPFMRQDIALCQNGLFIIGRGQSISVVDNRGKTIVPFGKYSQYATPPPLRIAYEKDDMFYSNWYPTKFPPSVSFNQYIGVKQKEKWAVINIKGEEIIPPVYDWIGIFNKDKAPMMIDKKYGVTDTAGNNVVPAVYDNTELTADNFVVVTNDKKAGVVSINNKLLIPIKYDDISQINANAFLVDTGTDNTRRYGIVDVYNKSIIPMGNIGITKFGTGYLVAVNNIKKGVFDAKGLMQGTYTSGRYDIDYPVWHNDNGAIVYNEKKDKFTSYESANLPVYNQNGKFGIMDLTGVEVTPAIYDEGRYKDLTNIVIVALNNRWGTVDKLGKQLIPLDYDQITWVSDRLLLLKKAGKYGLANSSSKIISPLKYDAFYFEPGDYNSPLVLQNYMVMVNKKWGYVNDNGKEITPVKYDVVKPMYHDVCYVNCNGKWGLVNSEGIEVIPCIYNELNITSQQLAVVKDKFYGLINRRTGDVVQQPIFKSINSNYINGNYVFFITNEAGKIGIVNDSGKLIFPFLYDYVQWITNNTEKINIVANNKKYGVADSSGRVVVPLIYDGITSWIYGTPKNYYLVNQGDKMGIIDYTGKPFIPLVYQQLDPLEGKRIAARKDNYVGVIDFANKMIIPFMYDDLHQGTADRYIVMINRKYGVLDLEGKKVMELIYDEVFTCFDSKLFCVKKNDKFGMADNTGKMIIEPFYDRFQICGKHTILVEKDHLMGLIDCTGKVIYSCKYTYIKCVEDIVEEIR